MLSPRWTKLKLKASSPAPTHTWNRRCSFLPLPRPINQPIHIQSRRKTTQLSSTTRSRHLSTVERFSSSKLASCVPIAPHSYSYTTPQLVRRASTSSKMAPIPKTMSGILIEENGGVEVLKWRTDLPVPELKEGEVLVKNEYIGVNYIDTYFRTGLYKAPLPLVTGKEAAGTIIAVHPSVSSFSNLKESTPVVYLADHAYAEFTAVPAASSLIIPLPADISAQTAAASLLQGLTALTLVKEAGGVTQQLGLSEGPWVLVHAAAGGTGSNMVQVLSLLGARVIGTAGGEEKCELVKGLGGAGWVIDSKSEDVVERVKEITGGKGVDVIFDGVGKATFDEDLEMVARKGTLVVFGNASGPVDPVNILRLGAKNVKLLRPVLFGYIHTKEERDQYTTELFELLRTDKLTVKVHDVYPLKDVARAHADLEGRKTTGKLLLKI